MSGATSDVGHAHTPKLVHRSRGCLCSGESERACGGRSLLRSGWPSCTHLISAKRLLSLYTHLVLDIAMAKRTKLAATP